jgi:hypothetical protein
MARRVCAALAALVLFTGFACFPGCTIAAGSSGACTDNSTAGPCTGSFPCGNSGIQISCDKATQVCVLQPGMVTCQSLTGVSATICPSPAAAAAQVGCQIAGHEMCSGSSTEGVTLSCE